MADFENTKLQNVSDAFSTTKKETKLTKGAQSKDITIADWNTVIAYLETLLEDVSRIYKKALSEIDVNLLSNPDAVYNAVYNHLKDNLNVAFSFDKKSGELGINLYDGTTELCSDLITDTGLNTAVTNVYFRYDPDTQMWYLVHYLLDGTGTSASLEGLINNISLRASGAALKAVQEKTKIDLLYTDEDGNLTVSLKDEAGVTLSSDAVNIPIESTIIGIDEYEDNGTAYLKLTLRNGNSLSVALDDVVKGLAKQSALDDLKVVLKEKLSKSAEKDTVYGVGPDGSQVQFPIVTGDADKTNENNYQLVSKQYVWLRNYSRSDQVKPTSDQLKTGTAIGWYRIAERSDTSDGTGGCTNIFKLHCYGTSQGESTLIFSVSMAEYTVTPAICILSNSYRLGAGLDTPPITKVRVNRASGKGKAYVEVYLNVSPALQEGKTCVRFKTETLLYDAHRRWVLIGPSYTEERLNNVTEKSVADHTLSDVTVSTLYLNALPDTLTSLEESVNTLAARVNELHPYWISMLQEFETYDEVDEALDVLQRNATKFQFAGSVHQAGVESGFADFSWEKHSGLSYFISRSNIVQEVTKDGACTFVAFEPVDDSYEIEKVGYGEDYSETGQASYDFHREVYSPDAISRIAANFQSNLYIKFKGIETPWSFMDAEDMFYSSWISDACMREAMAYVIKNDETSKYFPSTFSLRERSIKRQLDAKIEESIAKRNAAQQTE